MKASELMVGDWVLYCETPVRIIQLSEGKDYKEICPIPLTPGILEKNGFIESSICPNIFQCCLGEVIIEIGVYDPMFINVDYRINSPEGINSGNISHICHTYGKPFYVNELQHALRLCGIDKEIQLNP